MAEYKSDNMDLAEVQKRLVGSRMRLLNTQPFYAMLLLGLRLSVDYAANTAYTDGARIAFNPDFLESLSEDELDFVMMHEVLHVALLHCYRGEGWNQYIFNIACDIVVNSNIFYSMAGLKKNIKILGEVPMNKTPSGEDGYLYTAEEVYKMLMKSAKYITVTVKGRADSGLPSSDPQKGHGNDKNKNGPGNTEKNGKSGPGGSMESDTGTDVGQNGRFDDHGYWQVETDSRIERDTWIERVLEAAEIASTIADKTRGKTPLGAERMLNKLRKPETDWREVLRNFIEEDVSDYSFSPPDRRFADSPFFLPDFNQSTEQISDILFMIDASASMTNQMLSDAYSEVKGALTQFDGRVKGWLGFFDATVIINEFNDEDEFKVIHPKGGGGTAFEPIFEYVRDKMQERPPRVIIILTDGYAPFPSESVTMGIPTLWIINNTDVNPPWGRVARISGSE